MNKCLFNKIGRLLAAVFLSCLLPVAAMAQSQARITLKMDNAPLQEVIDAVERQSQYLFLMDQVDVQKTVSINVENQPLDIALDQIFKGTGLSWSIQGTNVYISMVDTSKDSPVAGGGNRVEDCFRNSG